MGKETGGNFLSEGIPHNLARSLFVILAAFEALNYLGIFSYRLQFTWLGLLITTAGVLFLIEIVGWWYGRLAHKRLPAVFWYLALLGLGLDFTGDFLFYYTRFGWWDQLLHAYNSLIVFLFLAVVVRDMLPLEIMHKTDKHRIDKNKVALFLSAVFCLALGALYEIEEYSEDLLFGSMRSGQGGDTANDLLFNLTGIFAGSVILSIYQRTKIER